MARGNSPEIVVVGQIARDLVLSVDEMPAKGGAVPVRRRQEMLGGKGANQAVACAQLGAGTALIGVVGDDQAGDNVLRQARSDGIDVSGVVRRQDASTGLIVDVLEPDGGWRYLEDLPTDVLLTESDVEAARSLLEPAGSVLVQLQQPSAAALTAARLGKTGGARVVLDGAPAQDDRGAALLAAADVFRLDAKEAELFCGERIGGADDGLRVGRELLRSGPSLVAVDVAGKGNAVVWPDGQVFLPLIDTEVVDTTGAGDAFTAALTVALDHGAPPPQAARTAVAAAASSVERAGGRPDLTGDALRVQLDRLTAVAPT
ncbi:ribokinase [Amycolatopsis marina]|uniref:Ribokinase n=1 Tax=Amycolatopsis marina TaxID=490629 RepID=A0A1I0Z1B9_9PSEU|nr:PfkB family carbohydrate kinase [Amycolatopsis marina]SFB19341.1 ribokinase [Amycolatopsis marina]